MLCILSVLVFSLALTSSDVALLSSCTTYLSVGSPDQDELSSDSDLYYNLTQECFKSDGHLFGNCSLEAELSQAAQGTGLAFIVMADVFAKLPGAPLWSFLFFAMLLALGLGSQIGILEGVLGTLFDMPQLKGVKKPILSGAACLCCFSIGILFTTGAGEYWLTLFDDYGAMGLTLIAFAEIVTVMYVYGHRRFTDDIYRMTGTRPGIYWQLMWRLVAPAVIAVILISSVISQIFKTPEYSAWIRDKARKESTGYPPWCLVVAGMLAVASVVPIVLVAAMRMCGANVLSVQEPDQGSTSQDVTQTAAEEAQTKPTDAFLSNDK